jgi:hypothetical protein
LLTSTLKISLKVCVCQKVVCAAARSKGPTSKPAAIFAVVIAPALFHPQRDCVENAMPFGGALVTISLAVIVPETISSRRDCVRRNLP